ncbi:unnamed protein product, partial [Ectocarpus sp. 4 AP-2014]
RPVPRLVLAILDLEVRRKLAVVALSLEVEHVDVAVLFRPGRITGCVLLPRNLAALTPQILGLVDVRLNSLDESDVAHDGAGNHYALPFSLLLEPVHFRWPPRVTLPVVGPVDALVLEAKNRLPAIGVLFLASDPRS